MMPSIPPEEVEFHPLSYEDECGRLFWRNGCLYRGITLPWAPFFEDLFQRGVIDELVREGLLAESRLTDLTMPGYPRIVEHSVIPFVSFAHEWCPEMLRDAGRLILDLAAGLHSRGLELVDAHPGNVLYQGPQPLFVDLGAIGLASQESAWPEANVFREYFLNPLYLASAGAGDVARALMQTTFYGRIFARHVRYVNLREKLVQRVRTRVRRLAGHAMPAHVQQWLRERLPRHRSGASQTAHLADLKEELESIPLPRWETDWPGDQGDNNLPFEPSPGWNPKHHRVFETLTRARPATVLDLGANRGWYSRMAARHGASVVAIDMDGACISHLYAAARAQSLSILPLTMDLRAPSPARGLCGELYPAAWDRLRCDFVLALDIVHHLALGDRLNFEQIVGLLKRFTKRWLLVEFPRPEDHISRKTMRAGDTWYTSENFAATLERHFRTVACHPSESATRELYLCEL